MKTIMARTQLDSSFSSSKRYFQWRRKKEEDEESLNCSNSSICEMEVERGEIMCMALSVPSRKKKPIPSRKKKPITVVPKLRSILTVFSGKNRCHVPTGLGNHVTGTLFGYRQGHAKLAFQEDPTRASPALLIELAVPTNRLVFEMASGVVRVALECDKKVESKKMRLVEETIWRMYCNGRKCGSAKRHECGPEEWKVLRAVEPVSVGAGVLPGIGSGYDNDIMYMRASFERVVGSKNSEAFHMINPDGIGGSELSIYFLRV